MGVPAQSRLTDISPMEQTTTAQKISAIASREENKPVIRKLIFYTVVTATLPIAAYYASHDYIFHEIERAMRAAYSGVVAVVMVNVVIAAYAISAWNEPDDPPDTAKPPTEADKKSD